MPLQSYEENTSIHFKNMQSSNKEDFLRAKDSLDRLLRKAPCGSKCRLKISISGSTFKGFLEVKSLEKIFYAKGEASTVKELQKSLFQKVSKELLQWKRERSLEDLTGSIKLESLSIEKKKEKKSALS